jgi:hypothetical protein
MAGGVAHRIGFRLDDSPAQPAPGQIVNERLADQESRELERIHGQFCAAETADAVNLMCWDGFIH